jgi:hypothetical protein
VEAAVREEEIRHAISERQILHVSERGYTPIPKPYTQHTPALLRAPSWTTIAVRPWRARRQHAGLLAAFRAERSTAVEHTQRENARAAAHFQAARDAHHAQWEKAQRTFAERHQ